MPGFAHSLVVIGDLYDASYTLTFAKHEFTVYRPYRDTILAVWRDQTGNKLWQSALRPDQQPAQQTNLHTSTAASFVAFDLPNAKALVLFYHAAAGFPVKSTWLEAIKEGEYSTWPGLSHNTASKILPQCGQNHQRKYHSNAPSDTPHQT